MIFPWFVSFVSFFYEHTEDGSTVILVMSWRVLKAVTFEPIFGDIELPVVKK